jgi:hypothetical protein
VLYAEHGNQHHDLNRFPDILAPFSRRRPAEMHVPPLATDAPTSGRSWRRRAGLAAVLAGTWWEDRRWTTLDGRRQLAPWAHVARFDLELAVALQRTSRVRIASTGPRLARLAARQALGREAGPPDAYLVRAAERVRRTCAGHGATFPFYVFGHSHIARDVVLGDGRSRYLNCGTWSSHMHADDPAIAEPDRFSYVEIERTDDRVAAGVRSWLRPSSSPPRPYQPFADRSFSCALD